MIKQNHYEVHIINEIKERYNLDILSDKIEAIFDYIEIKYYSNNKVVKTGNIFTLNKNLNQHTEFEFTITHNREGEIQSCVVVESGGGAYN